MKKTFDVAIIGLGAMGSAAAYQLAKGGRSVVAFDRFAPPHGMGSTHGQSRVIREACFEHPFYVPLVRRAYEAWHRLEKESGAQVLHETGGIWLGSKTGTLIAGTRLSADRYGIDYEILGPKDIRKRYPIFETDDGTTGLWEPHSGILLPESCVEAHMTLAQQHGAVLHLEEAITEWEATADRVRLQSDKDSYEATKLVLSPGAWMSTLLPDVPLPLTVERQVILWFEPARNAELFATGRLPIYAWEYADGMFFYGFPNLGDGIKVALHHQGIVTDVESIDREVGEDEIAIMRTVLDRFIPDLNGPYVRGEVCMYTNTPDEHFIIDHHPQHDNVLIVSPCSGHGFKFASVIGEIVFDLIEGNESDFDLTPFSLRRFMDNP